MSKVDAYRVVRRGFNKGCVRYGLLEDGDRILVAVSGGKDSLALVHLMAERARIFRPHIEVEAVHVVMENIPYATDIDYLTEFCSACGIRLHVLTTRFEEKEQNRKPNCFLCSWHRRKAIFRFAKEHRFNKIALGHHNDDFLITLLMNMTFEGRTTTMQPSMVMEHYPITVIRPLCLVEEHSITEVATTEGFRKQKCQCPFEDATKRATMKEMFARLQDINPEARYSLWRCAETNFSIQAIS